MVPQKNQLKINHQHPTTQQEAQLQRLLLDLPVSVIHQKINFLSNINILALLIANGDIIVTLYPLNDHCAWITPATFKAHLVPEELMAQPLTVC